MTRTARRGVHAERQSARRSSVVAPVRLTAERACPAREVTADPEPLESEADDRLGPGRDEREPVAVERQTAKGRLDVLVQAPAGGRIVVESVEVELEGALDPGLGI